MIIPTITAHQVLDLLEKSNLQEFQKNNLKQFVERFPQLEFTAPAEQAEPAFPEWLQQFRSIFRALNPGKVTFVTFDSATPILPNDPTLSLPKEYQLSFSPKVSSEHHALFYQGKQVYKVAQELKTFSSFLFVITDPTSTDTTVYECRPDHEEKWYGVFSPRDSAQSWNIAEAHTALADYSEVFAHIQTVEVK